MFSICECTYCVQSSWFKREYIVATTRTGDSAGKIAKELNVEAHNDNKVAVSSADIVYEQSCLHAVESLPDQD
jgi:pyrroline-5-carboxylate reductase